MDAFVVSKVQEASPAFTVDKEKVAVASVAQKVTPLASASSSASKASRKRPIISALAPSAESEWNKIEKPVTLETFSAWFSKYQAESNAKAPRLGVSSSASALPQSMAPAKIDKARKTALLKGIISSMKANMTKKVWHDVGSVNDVAAETVMCKLSVDNVHLEDVERDYDRARQELEHLDAEPCRL